MFPKYKQRLIDAINPVLNAFDFNEVKKNMISSVDKSWQKIKDEDESKFLQLIDVFWFLKPTDTLIFIKAKIESINTKKMLIDEINFKADSTSSLPEFLSTLTLFRFLGEAELKNSLDLFLLYAEKQPQDTSKILHCFIDRYGFQPDSYHHRYYVQRSVVDKILGCCCSGENEYFTRMFIALAGDYLHTHFSSTRSKGHKITITNFDLLESSDLLSLRENIINNLIIYYNEIKFQDYVLTWLMHYSSSRSYASVGSIIEHDSKILVPFLENNLESANLYHCIIVQQYLQLLNECDIQTEANLKTLFMSSIYKLYELLVIKLEKIEERLNSQQYQKHKRKKILNFTESYSKRDYDIVLHGFSKVKQKLDDHTKWQINRGVIDMVDELANRDLHLFREVIKDYLQEGDYLAIDPFVVVSDLIQVIGVTESLDIIANAKFPLKNKWLFYYYYLLSEDDIGQEQIDDLTKLYQASDYEHIINDMDYLLKFESIEKGFIKKIVKIIIDRANATPEFANNVTHMFNKHAKINTQLLLLFSSNLTMLEDAYMTVDKVHKNLDYDGSTFSKLLDNDEDFIDRYLNNKFSSKTYLSSYDNNRDYSFIWLRDDFMNVMRRITDIIFKKDREGQSLGFFESFFNKSVRSQTDETILERQNAFLNGEIENKHNDSGFIHFLFDEVIVEFESGRRLIFYKKFLKTNNNFDDFKRLPFESSLVSWSGSAVPMLQQKIETYEKLISMCKSVDFLKHRQFLEQRIQETRRQIQVEKKRDFTEE